MKNVRKEMNKAIIIVLTFLLNSAWAKELCIMIPVPHKEVSKVFLKYDDKKNDVASIAFLANKEIEHGNGFFCVHSNEVVTCKGDDNSGTLILKKGIAKIKFLAVHKAKEDDYLEVKEIKEWLGFETIDCSKFAQK